MKIQNSRIQECMHRDCVSFNLNVSNSSAAISAKQSDLDQITFRCTKGISADETLFARSLAHGITDEVCQEHGISTDHVSRLKKEVADGTYNPDPMAIARAMYQL